MSTKIINGRELSNIVKAEVKVEIDKILTSGKRKPNLAVILVGDDEASKIYVKNKQKAAEEINIDSQSHFLPTDSSKSEVMDEIMQLNANDNVDGILLQLPLPDHLRKDENDLLTLIDPAKDVDGFHPLNIGKLNLGLPGPVTCTPAGIIRMLEETGQDLSGKHAVILGRSNTVGKPLIQLLLQKNCTVTVTHSKTQNMPEITKQADILIAAIGQSEFVTGDMVKDGVIVIDVGINRQEDGKLKGDVHFDSVSEKATYITKVPGGVGPMTVAMLMSNTLDCYKRRNGIEVN